MTTKVLPAVIGNCPGCRSPRTAHELAKETLCSCGTANYIAYEYDDDRIRLLPEIINRGATVRALERRLDVIAENLKATDPLAAWAGAPALAWHTAAAVLGIGAVVYAFSIAFAVMFLIAGVVMLVAQASTYLTQQEAYRTATWTSSRNAEVNERLKSQAQFYRDLLALTLQIEE